jgi:hypothetical protein
MQSVARLHYTTTEHSLVMMYDQQEIQLMPILGVCTMKHQTFQFNIIDVRIRERILYTLGR